MRSARSLLPSSLPSLESQLSSSSLRVSAWLSVPASSGCTSNPSHQHTPCAGSHPRGISTSAGAQQLGSAFSLVLDSLGSRVWETGHSLSHLPWWASIPLTTFALRGLMLPLSVKAKAASANVVLLDAAFSQARQLSQTLSPSETRSLGSLALVRAIHSQLKARHPAPSMKWYAANMTAQAAVFCWLTSSMNTMAASVWPGLENEGPPYFTDLTNPPLFFDTLSTPYGTAGAVLPLGMVLLYTRALSYSLAVRGAPGVNTALQLLMVPAYCAALIQPHATLLYWASNLLAHIGLQASSLGRPSSLQSGGTRDPSQAQTPHTASASTGADSSAASRDMPAQSTTSEEAPQHDGSSGGSASGVRQAGSKGGEASTSAPENSQQQNLQGSQQEQREALLDALKRPITQDARMLSQLGDHYAFRGKREAAAVFYKLATMLSGEDVGPRKEALDNFKQGVQELQQMEQERQISSERYRGGRS